MSIPPKAFAVIATETEASHDKDAATKLEGVQPGITLPLFVASRVVGTVGITGSPSTITPFGEIVRAQTETMLRETMLVRLALLRDQALEELLADVAAFDAESSSQEALMTRGEELGFRLDLPRAAVVVTFSARPVDEAPAGDGQRGIRVQMLGWICCGPRGTSSSVPRTLWPASGRTRSASSATSRGETSADSGGGRASSAIS
jgi:hypothetical protein